MKEFDLNKSFIKKLTPRQSEALTLLIKFIRVLLYGGARSGKTFLIICVILLRAVRYPGSRHLIARLRYSHAKASIWLDTLPVAVQFLGIENVCRFREVDHYVEVKHSSGEISEIWVDGLDDKERVDKILGREYCVSPSSLILTSDLQWVRADSLCVGDDIVAFPENIDGHMKLISSKVVAAEAIQKPRIKITTTKGTTIVSEDHRFVGYFDDRRTRNYRSLSWIRACDLNQGDYIRFACEPWESDCSWENGWMAGMLDGEGWVSDGATGVAQVEGEVLQAMRGWFVSRGVAYREHQTTSPNGKVCKQLIAKGMWSAMKLVGITQPLRLDKNAIWEGRRGFVANGASLGVVRGHGHGPTNKDAEHVAEVLDIEHIGMGDVCAIQTSTGTLIADGFPGHNCTIYLNEVSQIPYSTVTTVLTRLAQKIEGCTPKLFLDENPPSKFHWSNRLFLQGIDPESGEHVESRHYASLQMNPIHNKENLPEGYMDTLEKLPLHKRRRFLDGEFGDVEGVIFTSWDIVDDIPEEVRNHRHPLYGLDFGFSVDPAALVECWLVGDDLYIKELIYQTGLTNKMLAEEMIRLGVKEEITADSAEPKSIEELKTYDIDISGAAKGPDSVRQGIDWLLSNKIHVTRDSVSIQAELENYCWRENKDGKPLPEPEDDWNHGIDAIRYGMEKEIRAYAPLWRM